MKKWFAFDVGPNGGIATNALSGPLNSREEAEKWATTRFPKTAATQIAIAEVVAYAERVAPPIVFKDTTTVIITEDWSRKIA